MVCWSGLFLAEPTLASSLLWAMPTELVKSVQHKTLVRSYWACLPLARKPKDLPINNKSMDTTFLHTCKCIKCSSAGKIHK